MLQINQDLIFEVDGVVTNILEKLNNSPLDYQDLEKSIYFLEKFSQIFKSIKSVSVNHQELNKTSTILVNLFNNLKNNIENVFLNENNNPKTFEDNLKYAVALNKTLNIIHFDIFKNQTLFNDQDFCNKFFEISFLKNGGYLVLNKEFLEHFPFSIDQLKRIMLYERESEDLGTFFFKIMKINNNLKNKILPPSFIKSCFLHTSHNQLKMIDYILENYSEKDVQNKFSEFIRKRLTYMNYGEIFGKGRGNQDLIELEKNPKFNRDFLEKIFFEDQNQKYLLNHLSNYFNLNSYIYKTLNQDNFLFDFFIKNKLVDLTSPIKSIFKNIIFENSPMDYLKDQPIEIQKKFAKEHLTRLITIPTENLIIVDEKINQLIDSVNPVLQKDLKKLVQDLKKEINSTNEKQKISKEIEFELEQILKENKNNLKI